MSNLSLSGSVAILALGLLVHYGLAEKLPPLVRSAGSGAWSEPATWEGKKLPGAGARVQIREGHTVTYDVASTDVIRSIHIAGTLSFTRDKPTRLEVGLIKIQAGDDASENGFDCDAHAGRPEPGKARPALEIGTDRDPVNQDVLIRLHYVEGMDKETCPAIVCCGGRMDIHGRRIATSWGKLDLPAKAGDTEVTLKEVIAGWGVGDRVILTATTRQNKVAKTFKESTSESSQTEERIIKAINDRKITLDKPLTYTHTAQGDYRADVGNLSRSVVIESADPEGVRGHTMYHRHSAGSITHAEFRHLGKYGILGKYPIHYHLVGDTMRGSCVLGCSIWDSHNRWVTIHGTNYLVVRDNVGYKSRGHGFFLEDGTEVFNNIEHNLAVQAYIAPPLPKQVFPFDKNDGSGFWWANSHNSFTRNVAAECDEYGYFFQAANTPNFDPVLPIQQPDGTFKKTDIRTLPFINFEDNEAHCQRRHAFNLGGGVPFGEPNVGGVGPDEKHPFIVRGYRAWNVHWAIHPVAPNLILDHADFHNAEYAVWRPVYKGHVYRDLKMITVPEKFHYAFVDGPPESKGDFPAPLAPVDDLPPITVVLHSRMEKGNLVVSGVTADNGTVKRVVVNGVEATAWRPNFSEWTVTLKDVPAGELKITAHAEDMAGNVEKRPHVLTVPTR
jgi:hypothetical protein